MKNLLLYSSLFLVLFSCTPQAHQAFKTVEELKAEVLNLACNNEVRRMYERKIAEQSLIFTEIQLKKSLENMIEDMKCQ